MVLSELAARLNCAEYKNWVKAGHCLLLLRSCLQGFVDREVLSFHRGLLAAVPGLGPHATCRGGSRCSPRARQVSFWPWTWAHIHSLSPIPCACCLFPSGAGLLTTPRGVPILLPRPSWSHLTSTLCSFSLSVRCAQSGNARS